MKHCNSCGKEVKTVRGLCKECRKPKGKCHACNHSVMAVTIEYHKPSMMYLCPNCMEKTNA